MSGEYLILAALPFVVMNAVYLLGRATRRDALIDAGWAFGTGLMAAGVALAGEGELWRRLMLAALASAWSIRLGVYLLRDRVLSGKGDGRYQALREHWGGKAGRNFFLLHQAQAVVILLLALAFYPAANNPASGFRLLDALALLIWFAAVAGESLADAQLARWRSNPGHRGETCRTGLWRYTRHPNYFFEWLHWWAYVPLAASAPYPWLALLGPALMFAFLYRFTGIPYAEAQALRSRGEDYARYQRETSPFIPWFPREENAS